VLVLAHIGHWYHALLYLAPVFVLVVFFAIQGRREGRAEENDAGETHADDERPDDGGG
jgi:hypothetical protein